MKKTRIILADDHQMIVEAFQRLLEPAYEIVCTASDGKELLEVATKYYPDIILLDVQMPKLNGIDAAIKLKKILPGTKIIFLTSNSDPVLAAEAMSNGASGFLLKSSAGSELILAIEAALKGQSYITPAMTGAVISAAGSRSKAKLTPRQREVLQLLVNGLTMKAIAKELNVSPSTVAHHKYTMMDSLGLKSSAELIQYAMRQGF